MATLSRSESKHMYSWWWDSHNSPKNSKWLLENLTDMDSRVKTMIKLIEVDEDSFARRAEMYYKKRPELMKLVEEFYRAYRALAERYDHATGVIRQAHKTMAEAFPNQVPSFATEDGPVNPAQNFAPRTPEIPSPMRAFLEHDELLKGADANGNFTSDSDSLASRKGSKQLNGVGKARKGLNFHGAEERGHGGQKNEKAEVQTRGLSESERIGRSETDIQALKEVLAKLEAEKEAGLLQHQQTLERLSKLESDFSQANEDSKGLNERASKAEAEVQKLKEALANVEAEREASLRKYQQCLDRVSNMEIHLSHAEEDAGQLNDRASKAEKDAEILKEELSQFKAEKEALLAKYMESLEKIANLENKLLLAEDYASRTCDRAERAEREVETLRETIARLVEEKEAAVRKSELCVERIATLEREIILIQEEAERLKADVQDGVVHLKESEERCLLLDKSNKALQSEVNSLEQKVGIQNHDLSEKQRELGRLWACVQEERMRFMEAEAAFEKLQNMHSKVQEELRSVATELQKKVELMKALENQKLHLADEVQKAKDENKSLNDFNLSSAVSMKSMQEEILGLKTGKEKLEQELELQLDQKNALQQEIYCSKEEFNSLSQRHQDVLRQVESVGFDPESLSSSIKEMQDENSNLKESCQKNTSEIAALVEKLGVMEKLVQKNELLENSLSDLSVELEEARWKVKELEESCQLIMGEKSALATEKATLISQLQMTTENLESLSQRNTLLENSLFDVNAELETLRVKSKSLEDSCSLLNDQNSILVTEKQILTSELETTHSTLEDLGIRHAELEQRYSNLEEERESTLRKVEELQVTLDAEKEEHANSNELSQTRIADLENEICLLQESSDHMREVLEEELDNAVNAQFEIFILRKYIQDQKENNSSLLGYCRELMEASSFSEKLISELQQVSLGHQDEVRMVTSQIDGLRMGIFHFLDANESDAGPSGDVYCKEDQRVINRIREKLDGVKASLCKVWDENQELIIEKSVLVELIRQLKKDVVDLNALVLAFQQEVSSRNGEVLLLQKETQKLLESNEELILKVREGSQREIALIAEVENLQGKLLSLQGAYEDLQKENCKIVEEKKSLMNTFEDLKDEKDDLENDCSCMVGEVVELGNLSFIFKNVIWEKSEKVAKLNETIEKLCSSNHALEEKVTTMESNLEDARMKNSNFELSLRRTENDLEEVRVANDQLKTEISNEKNLICLKEMELLESDSVKLHQQHQIHELSENYAQQLKECEELRQLIQNLDSQIVNMQKVHEEGEATVRILSSELQKGKDEVELWETVAGTFFAELQSSSVREALIKEKFAELIKAYDTLEQESHSKYMDVDQLRERVGDLEDENSEIKARLAADLSAIMCLKDSVASLEQHAIGHIKIHPIATDETQNTEDLQSSGEPHSGGFVNLHEVQARIQGVEQAVIEQKQHAEQEYASVRSDLDSALRQIETLKAQSSLRRGGVRMSRRVASHLGEGLKNGSGDVDQLKPSPDVSETGEELLMKDIVLDQASDCSSYGRNRKVMGSDDQILELWETIDHSGSIDLTVGKSSRAAPTAQDKYSHLDSVKENKSGRPSSELFVEKELVVDEQLSSKRFANPQQDDNKRKTLERLASDVQKLTNLQITVQDFKEKLDMIESNPSKGKVVECDGVKDQLLEMEQTILKLFDYSAKVMKNIEKSSSASSSMSLDGPSVADSSDGGNARRKKSMDQARRISEKIGRLQLEVQKVQFLLMKLDNNKVGKGGTRIVERSSRVLLRDYLYGGSRTPRRRKRTHFCGCVQPNTRGSD